MCIYMSVCISIDENACINLCPECRVPKWSSNWIPKFSLKKCLFRFVVQTTRKPTLEVRCSSNVLETIVKFSVKKYRYSVRGPFRNPAVCDKFVCMQHFEVSELCFHQKTINAYFVLISLTKNQFHNLLQTFVSWGHYFYYIFKIWNNIQIFDWYRWICTSILLIKIW